MVVFVKFPNRLNNNNYISLSLHIYIIEMLAMKKIIKKFFFQ